MPQIEITEHDLKRLKKIAEPLVDTSATAFARIMDFFERHNPGPGAKISLPGEISLRDYAADKIPPLIHTKMLMGRFAGKPPDRSTWDSLVRLALITAYDKHGDLHSLRRISGANVADATKKDEGYKPVSGYPFSYQGMSAEDAARCVVRCARALGCEAVFEFEWRQKDEAYSPGQRGRVTVPG